MKTVLTIILLFGISATTFAQDEWTDELPDSLASVILDFETLNLKQIISKETLGNTAIPNVVTYFDAGGIKIAYYTTDKNKWTSVVVPFSLTTNDFKLINIDQKGPTELVVRGRFSQYGTGGGTEDLIMIILSLGKVPRQIFKIIYGFEEESFGDKNNDGAGRYLHTFIRKIKITNQGIIISPIPKDADGNFTLIPSGVYRMQNGKFVRTK